MWFQFLSSVNKQKYLDEKYGKLANLILVFNDDADDDQWCDWYQWSQKKTRNCEWIMYEPNMSDMFQTQIRWAGMIRIEMNDEKTFSINIVDSKKKIWCG